MRDDSDDMTAALERLASAQEHMARKLDRISDAIGADSPGSPGAQTWLSEGSRAGSPKGSRAESPRAFERSRSRGEVVPATSRRTVDCENTRASSKKSQSQANCENTRASSKKSQSQANKQLPDSWPWSLEMRGEWEYSRRSSDEGDSLLLSSAQTDLLMRANTLNTPQMEDAETKGGFRGDTRARIEGSRYSFVIDPTTHAHMVYDLVCLSFIGYDLLVLPYCAAWEVDLSQSALIFAVATCVWWVIDFCLNFTTAYHLNRALVRNRSAIISHYARTWLVPDLALIVIDAACLAIIFLAASGDGPVSKLHPVYAIRLVRAARILRVANVLRILKRAKVVKAYLEKNALSESWQLYTTVASTFVITLLITHWAACGWYAVGVLASDTGESWTELVRDHKLFYQYTTAFHFAVAELTLASTEIACMSSAERLYNCVLLMLGLLFGSSLVSGLSASMVQAQMDQKERRVKLHTLLQFMKYHKVESALACRVKQQAFARMRASRRVQYESVTVLKDLSVSLVSELRFHICRPYISTHGLFRVMVSLNKLVSERICSEAVRFQGLMCQDDLFVAGNEPGSAYVVVDGTLVYTPSPLMMQGIAHGRAMKVSDGSWLAEAALWSRWIHVGNAAALTECTVLALPIDKMTIIVRKDPTLQSIMGGYCREFHRRLTDEEFSTKQPTDLGVPLTSFDEVVTSMDGAAQRAVYQAAINETIQVQEQLGNTWWQHKAKLPLLQEEVDKSTSAVLLNAEGDLYRVVRTSVGRVELDDGRVLVEVGRVDRSANANSSGFLRTSKFKHVSFKGPAGPIKTTKHIRSNCVLPSLTSEFSETPRMTWERMLLEGLKDLAKSIEVLDQEYQQEWVDSPELGVRTLHQKTVFQARVSDEDELFGEVLLPNGSLATRTVIRTGGTAYRRPSQGSDANRSETSDIPGLRGRPSWFGADVMADSAGSNTGLRHGTSYWDDVLANPDYEKEIQASIVVVCVAPGKEVLYRWTPPMELEELVDRQDQNSRRALGKFLSRFDARRCTALKTALPGANPPLPGA